MSRLWKFLLITAIVAGLLLPASLAAVGCGGETTTTATTEAKTATVATTADTKALETRADEVLAADAGDYGGNSVAADKLSTMLADPAQKQTLYLLDIRPADDFAKGHIEGATNVPFVQWAAPDSLKSYPADKTIVVICSSGATAAETVGGMRMLGFDAIALKGGMMGWTQSSNTQQVISDLQAANNPVVNTAPSMPAASSTAGGPLTKPSNDLYESIAGTANTFMSSMPTSGDYANNVITADVLKTKLADATEAGKLYLLDIRKSDVFQSVGHIDGAMSIPFKDLGAASNLKMLPKDKKIIVICYTGNTAAQAAMILNLLGYDAVSLAYGEMGWAVTPETDGYVQYLQKANYPVV
jgi:rhodanese-related sulfurtransferase